MRISRFQSTIIWLVSLIIFAIITFNFELKGEWHSIELVLRFVSILSIIIWILILNMTLPEIIALRYKIVEKKPYSSIETKYLTFGWLFIPCWKAIDKKYHSYKAGNLFCGTWEGCYTTDVTYKNKMEATSAIEKHRKKIKKNREDWFKISKQGETKVSYIKKDWSV